MFKKFILFSAALVALLCSCDKDSAFQPATAISGEWVFSAANTGTAWKELKVDKIYVFAGDGTYGIKEPVDGGSGATFYNGKVYAEESAYEYKDSKAYTVKCSGDSYRFESIKGDFTLSSSEEGQMDFAFSSSDSAIRGYRLSKLTSYAEAVDPEDPKKPEEPEEPQGSSINGTSLLDGNDLVGLVSDSSTGLGIPGVVVSDGYDCVATDANGVYQFKSNTLSRLVFISIPSAYKVPVSGSSLSRPVFYVKVAPNGNVIRNDFTLSPLPAGPEQRWTFIGIGDPQCATAANANRYKAETIPDIKTTLSGRENVYAMTLGDIVFDSTDMWPAMVSSMSSVYNGVWFIPFFQTIGNHDHDSLKPDTADNAMDDYNATSTFVSNYGPTDYSFNRGDVHIVSMDNIPVTSQATSSHSNGKTWSYGKGFSASQLEWLKKDLDLVPDKDKKMIFICSHIPFRNASNSSFSYCQDVLKLLAQFKEAHLMIGHTHYTQNYVYNSLRAKGGLPLYEHIHGSACGAWWTATSSSTVTGEPSGYTIYDIEGAHIKDWHFKGTNKSIDNQLRVFDGNDIYYSSKTYPLNWYTASQTAGSASITVKGNANLKGCFVAQLFNDDDTYWKVELVRKSTGAKIGDFRRLANGASTNVAMSSFYFNVKSKNSTSYASTTASHYWYYKPESGDPSSETDWEVVVTQTLPAGDVQHTYKCSVITRESNFAKEFYF